MNSSLNERLNTWSKAIGGRGLSNQGINVPLIHFQKLFWLDFFLFIANKKHTYTFLARIGLPKLQINIGIGFWTEKYTKFKYNRHMEVVRSFIILHSYYRIH